jgi:hypothetical protein
MKGRILALSGLTWLSMAFFLIQPVFAVTHYVPDNYPTIQAAVDAAGVGDRIVVRSGTYRGEGNKNIIVDAKWITIESESGYEHTIIDCEGDGRGFSFMNVDDFTSLTGFKVINGSADSGGAIYLNNASLNITNCIMSGNSSSEGGGGIDMFHSSPSITNCVISGNTTPGGGGGIKTDGGSPSFINCLITDNHATSGWGGAANSYHSSPVLINCTVAGNSAWADGGWFEMGSALTLTNAVMYFNFPYLDYPLAPGHSIIYSNIAGGYEGEGNIDVPPEFVGGGDYRLSEGSPCIDTGTANGAPDYDLDGNPRPYGAGYDMGAYEYQGSAPNPPDIKANGEDGPIIVSPTTPVAINIAIDPGGYAGQNVELWIVVQWPFGRFWNYYSYVYPQGWLPGIARCIQMPLPALSSTNVLTTTLPPAEYEFFFLIDDTVDGIPQGTWLDSVKVKVTP